MAPRTFKYLVDDGGSSTAPYETWAKAASSLNVLLAAVTIAPSELIGVGHDSIDSYVYTAHTTYTAAGLAVAPVGLISLDRGVGSIASGLVQRAATANQINSSGTAFSIIFGDSWELEGIRINSGFDVRFIPGTDGVILTRACTYLPGPGRRVLYGSAGGSYYSMYDIVDDIGTIATESGLLLWGVSGLSQIMSLRVLNAGNRSDEILYVTNGAEVRGSGWDVSSANAGSGVELVRTSQDVVVELTRIKTPTTFAFFQAGNTYRSGQVVISGSGDATQPEQLTKQNDFGTFLSTTGVYRTGGSTVKAIPVSWGGPTQGIETTARCTRSSPFYTTWLSGDILTTGSKTFTIPLVMDGTILTKDQIWIEVEYKADASSDKWTLLSDQDDVMTEGTPLVTNASTWVGVGPSFTSTRVVELTATVNTTGLFRARVGIGKPSIVGSDHLYISPEVLVS